MESIADVLQYSSILEEKAYSLYKNLADKVDIPLAKSMLISIAFDSQKHSAIFRGFSESMGKPTKSRKDYEKRLGETLTRPVSNTVPRLRAELSLNVPCRLSVQAILEATGPRRIA
jgi:rubrerythrin